LTDTVIAPPAILPALCRMRRGLPRPSRRPHRAQLRRPTIEMGHDPDREPPFFFQKNPDSLGPLTEFSQLPERQKS